MKLRNKKTGQLGNFIINKDHFECVDLDYVPEYRNLAELNAEWEDYEESKEYWMIDTSCLPMVRKEKRGKTEDIDKEIGNYFETKEEAEKALEKLKAWKRLKDKGFRFDDWDYYHIGYKFIGKGYWTEETKKDMDLLFGGEE